MTDVAQVQERIISSEDVNIASILYSDQNQTETWTGNFGSSFLDQRASHQQRGANQHPSKGRWIIG